MVDLGSWMIVGSALVGKIIPLGFGIQDHRTKSETGEGKQCKPGNYSTSTAK